MKPYLKNALFLSLSLLAGVGVYKKLNPEKTMTALPTKISQEVGLPLLGGSFSLEDQKGKKRTDKDFSGKWMLVYFGYTFCPDICPTGLSAMSAAIEQVDPKGQHIQPLFITIDPERDTVENLKIYAENFHPNFVMLTGLKENIQKTMRAYRVYSAKVHVEGASDYVMDHSSIIYVMDPAGKYRAHFNHQTPAAEMAGKIKEILNAG